MTTHSSATFSRDNAWIWAAHVENRLGRGDGSVRGVLGLLGPRTLTKPTSTKRHDEDDVTNGGVGAWAGTTPVLGGLGRPKPTPAARRLADLRGSFPPTRRMLATGKIIGQGGA